MKCIALVIGIDNYNGVDNYPVLHTAKRKLGSKGWR